MPVDRYLAELDASLRGSHRERRDLLAEARDHLTDATQARMDAGATTVDAQAGAVRDFGAVGAIAPSYQAILSAGQCRRLSVWLMVLVIAQPLLWDAWGSLPVSPDETGSPSAAFRLADAYVEVVGSTAVMLAVAVLVGGRLAFRYLGIREWMLRLVLTGALVSSGLIVLVSAAMLLTSGQTGQLDLAYAAAVSWIPMASLAAASVRAMRAVDLTASDDTRVRATQT